MRQMIEYTRPDGKTASGYYASPEKDADSAPGIVVIEEWWGVTPQIMETADTYASIGYCALVPDLFHGKTAAVPDEAKHLVAGLDFQDAYGQTIRGALMHLKKNGRKAGVTGYCVGGSLALLTAMHDSEPDAVASFYGIPPANAGDPATIKIPVILHFGKRDHAFPPDVVENLEERLKAGHVHYELYWYDADHGFCNPQPIGHAGLGHYNAQAAREAWDRTVRFFKQTLQ
jgi:carboxymethylenebutenolidase